MKDNLPVLVIGGGINALGVIRNLGKRRIEVYCVVEKKDEAIYSKYCKGYIEIPGLLDGDQKLILFLRKFRKYLDTDVVIFPISDIAVLNITRIFKEIKGYHIIMSNLETVETLIEKKKFYKALIANKIPHPETVFVDSTDFSVILENIDTFPVFVKPSNSQIFSKKFGKKGFVANSKSDLEGYLKLMHTEKIEVMIQEIIQGSANNHFFIDGYFDKDSKDMALFARRRIRMWPLWFGNSTVCVSISLDEVSDMKTLIVNFLSDICYRGIFSAEFKKDPKDDVAKLIEVNARSWWYNYFPTSCGLNIILTAYHEAAGIKIKRNTKYVSNKFLVYFLEDFKSSLVMFTQKKLFFKEWVTPYLGRKNMAVLSWDDPLPFIASCIQNLRKIINKNKFINILN